MSHSNLNKRPELPEKFVAIEISISQGSAFMEAFVAACALIAHADGELARPERRRLFTAARNEPRLAPFSHEDIAEEFAGHVANYAFDPELANEFAIEKIAPLRGRTREAHAIVDSCRQVLVADGVAHPAEYRALDKIKRTLGIEPGEGAIAWVGAPPREAARRAA